MSRPIGPYPADAAEVVCDDPGLLPDEDAAHLTGAARTKRITDHCRNADCVVSMMTWRVNAATDNGDEILDDCVAGYSHDTILKLELQCKLPASELVGTSYGRCEALYATDFVAVNQALGVGYMYELTQGYQVIRYVCQGVRLTRSVTAEEPHYDRIRAIDRTLDEMFDRLCVVRDPAEQQALEPQPTESQPTEPPPP